MPSALQRVFLSFHWCFCTLLDQYQSCLHTNSIPDTEMEEEVQALERKLFLEEIAVNVIDERCNFLGRNFR